MPRRFLLVSGLILFACASAPRNLKSGAGAQPSQAQKAGASSDIVCQMEAPTGSLIVRRVCRRIEDIERDRFAAQDPVKSHIGTPQPKGVAP